MFIKINVTGSFYIFHLAARVLNIYNPLYFYWIILFVSFWWRNKIEMVFNHHEALDHDLLWAFDMEDSF